MKQYPPPLRWVRACAVLSLAWLCNALAADLPVALGPLQHPDLPNAKLTVANLTQLAATQHGAAKAQAERLAILIKNLFTAEYQVTKALTAATQAEAEARRKERNAADWMKPNILGRINEVASREALAKAAALRRDASQRLAEAREQLVEQLRETDSVIEDFHKLEEFDVVLVLVDTSATLAKRSLPNKAFTSTFPPECVAAARAALRRRQLQDAIPPTTAIDRHSMEIMRLRGMPGGNSRQRLDLGDVHHRLVALSALDAAVC